MKFMLLMKDAYCIVYRFFIKTGKDYFVRGFGSNDPSTKFGTCIYKSS